MQAMCATVMYILYGTAMQASYGGIIWATYCMPLGIYCMGVIEMHHIAVGCKHCMAYLYIYCMEGLCRHHMAALFRQCMALFHIHGIL